MSEAAAIARSREPVTADLLRSRLSDLGIAAGDVLLVHCSLSALGWVCGGPVTVIEALLGAVGPEGTVAMPAHSTDLSEPSNWMNPPVPAQWCSAIRATMPAFDPRRTPTRAMGAVAELFRTWPGAFRSDHPASSIAAIGAHAAFITAEHPLDDPMGDASPLGKLHALDARIVLAGVGRLRELVDFGARWLSAHRQPDGRPWTASSSAG